MVILLAACSSTTVKVRPALPQPPPEQQVEVAGSDDTESALLSIGLGLFFGGLAADVYCGNTDHC